MAGHVLGRSVRSLVESNPSRLRPQLMRSRAVSIGQRSRRKKACGCIFSHCAIHIAGHTQEPHGQQQLTENSAAAVGRSRLKHVEARLLAPQDWRQQGRMHVAKCIADENLADPLTKLVTKANLTKLLPKDWSQSPVVIQARCQIALQDCWNVCVDGFCGSMCFRALNELEPVRVRWCDCDES